MLKFFRNLSEHVQYPPQIIAISSTVDNSDAASRRRVTVTQLDVLWEFLNSNCDVALGHNKAAQAREYARRKWSGAAANLNAQGEGAVKDWKGWSKYWVDDKAKLKRRAADVRASQNQTGGGPSEVPPLNEIENKFILITGQDFGLGMPGIRVEPFEDNSSPRVAEELSIPEASALLTQHNLHLNDPVATVTDSEAYVGEPIQGEMQQPAPDPEKVQQPSAGTERRRSVRRRNNPLTQEAERQAVENSSRIRAEAATRVVAVLERISSSIDSIGSMLVRI